MRASISTAGIFGLVLALAAPGLAGEKDRVVPWQFKAAKGGKAAGRYDLSVVSGDSGVFAVSMTYADAKAVGKPKPGRPDVRTYAELDSKGFLGRYKRWKTKGKSALYWMAFVLDGKAKIRFEMEDGQKSKVVDLGAANEIVPLEPDQPLLAWLLVRGRTEHDVACMGTTSTAPGKALVRKDNQVEGQETWKVEGDCGTFSLTLDAAGELQKVTTEGRSWERVVVPQT